MASMLNSGNFVLYDDDSSVVWQSFDYPTDTILGGQNLTDDDSLISSMSKSDHSRGRFYLNVKSDGNLVAYHYYSFASDEDAYWEWDQQSFLCKIEPENNGRGPVCQSRSLYTRCIGNYSTRSVLPRGPHYRLCFNNSNKPGKKLHKSITSIYRATLDVDGNLRLYEHQFHFDQGNNSSRVVMLKQALNDTCLVKGFCGLNSYCSSNMSGDAACKCYRGFIPSKTKSSPNMPMDCVQMLSKDDCEINKDRTLLYNFTHFRNMSWGDIPYSVIPVLKMETCEKACQQDCVCGGAIYTNNRCNKYRLPLIYGRVQNDSSTVSVALLKIPSSTIAIIPPPTSNDTKPKVVVDNKRSLIMILSLTLGVVSLICLAFALSIFFTYRRQFN
ncbi:G-type lectin S-receptor-like serine/threonine protein kinase RLK1-like, partial [Trifolium medium]|nr:G-type lectin S-receptor-like serine/threonine protein kinase RLK1-like [Trifolium medium]